MKLRNRSDQAHLFAEILELLDDGNFLRVLDILRRCSFGHIACSLKASYEYFKTTKALVVANHLICPICRLRCDVDIKDLRCDLKRRNFFLVDSISNQKLPSSKRSSKLPLGRITKSSEVFEK